MNKSERIKSVHEYIDKNFSDHLERCRAFLRQKSISASGEGIVETAHIVGDFIKEIGGSVEFSGTAGFPIVYGKVAGAAPKTLIIYGMYDVQPAEEGEWSSPPFAAEIKDFPGIGPCVIARGAVNSKGALAGLFNALKSIMIVDQIPLNLIFTIEGEEEVGSPHFEEFIRAHRRDWRKDPADSFRIA